LFASIQSQWRAGAAGLIGLDYNVLYKKLDRMKLTEEQYGEWEADICTMEFAALAAMSTKED
jgi:hypothetical protein